MRYDEDLKTLDEDIGDSPDDSLIEDDVDCCSAEVM